MRMKILNNITDMNFMTSLFAILSQAFLVPVDQIIFQRGINDT